MLDSHGQLTDEDICAQMLQKNDCGEAAQHGTDDDEDDDRPVSPTHAPKPVQAMLTLKTISRPFLEQI